jgi:hypothetical protein
MCFSRSADHDATAEAEARGPSDKANARSQASGFGLRPNCLPSDPAPLFDGILSGKMSPSFKILLQEPKREPVTIDRI